MKASTLFSLIVISLIITTPSFTQDDNGWQIKENQLTYDTYAQAIGKLDAQMDRTKKFTTLLAKSNTHPRLQKAQIMNLRLLGQDSIATFQIPVKELEKFKNHLSWEMQHIGFPNLMTDLKGYGLVSQKQILTLKLENLKLKNAPADEITAAEQELQNMTYNLRQFLQTRHRVD